MCDSAADQGAQRAIRWQGRGVRRPELSRSRQQQSLVMKPPLRCRLRGQPRNHPPRDGETRSRQPGQAARGPGQAIRACCEHDHADRELPEVLLVRQTLVGSEEAVEVFAGRPKELAVGQTRPPALEDCLGIDTLQVSGETERQRFIKKNPHRYTTPSRRALGQPWPAPSSRTGSP